VSVAEHPGHPRRYTLVLSNWLMTGTFVVLGLFFVFTANDSPRGVDRPEPLWMTVGIVGVVASLTVALRAWRAGALVMNDSLVVRNIFRTYRLQRPGVAGFATVPAKVLGYPRTVVKRTNGTTVVVTTLGGRPEQPVLAKAFEELESWRTQDPSIAPDTDR
jgi:hypothetical protein